MDKYYYFPSIEETKPKIWHFTVSNYLQSPLWSPMAGQVPLSFFFFTTTNYEDKKTGCNSFEGCSQQKTSHEIFILF